MSHHTSSPILLATALLLACSGPAGDTATDPTTDPTSSSATATGTTAPEPTTTDVLTDSGPQPTTQPTSGTTVADTTGADTLDTGTPSPDLGVSVECDTWDEDCPEGQKCMPVSLDGDEAWESLICVPIAPEPDPLGAPCQVLGNGIDGLDTCEKHTICWDVDPRLGTGTCLGLCTGTPEDPTCADPGTACQIADQRVVNLCVPMCDPILGDCPDGELCLPGQKNSQQFICTIDPVGVEGHLFDPCEFANACDPGLYCLPSDLATECDPMAPGCCIPFCDLSKPNTCPGESQECLPWYEPNQAPPGKENVGICGLPQP